MRFVGRAERALVAPACAWVEARSRACGADEDQSAVFAMVVEEVVSNIVKFGGPAPLVEIEVTAVGDAIEIVVVDDGIAFDPTAVPVPRLDDDAALREIGGLGLVIVRAMTDELRYTREGARNRLWLRRSLR